MNDKQREDLFYWLDQLVLATSFPGRLLCREKGELLYSNGYEESRDPLLTTGQNRVICREAGEETLPFLWYEENLVAYGVWRLPEVGVLVLGPAPIRRLSRQERNGYALSHQLSPRQLSMTERSVFALKAVLKLVYYQYTGKELAGNLLARFQPFPQPEYTLQQEWRQEYYRIQEAEAVQHLSYQNELGYLQNIENGNVESFQTETATEFSLERAGRFANSIGKNMEYLVCSAITLVSRAAIRGGVNPSVAYGMSELYYQRLEQCHSVEEMIGLHLEMQVAFTRMVRKCREERSSNSYVERCKNYVANHLTTPFEIEEVAEELSLNKSYLSRLFKEETGLSIMQYARKKRVECATNLLKYSTESLSTIASYLCFSTQSHFGSVFKAVMGITPQRYREREQLVEQFGKAGRAENETGGKS